MNFLQLKQLVSYWVDDLTMGYFTDTQLGIFVNNAQKETQKMLLRAGENFYTKQVETTTIIGQSDYILPANFLKVNRLELIISGTAPSNEETRVLEQITMNQVDIIQGLQSTPTAWFIHRDRFVLKPVPDKAQTLRMYYSYRVADMVNDSDDPDVPIQYHEYIAVIAALDCYLKDDRQPDILLAKKKFYEEMMKKDMEDRSETKSRSVVVTEESAFEVY